MEDYYEYLDSNGVTTLYKLIKDDTVALIDSYSVTINGITTTLDTHINNMDIHTPISDIENMVDTKIAGLVNSAPETLDTLKELSDALGNDPNFATTVANQIGNKANKDDVYTKEETDTLLEGKANSVHNHVVSDITDFPTIPTKVSELSNDSNFVTSTELHDYATKNDLNSKQDALSEEQLSNIDSIPDKVNKSDLSTVATSGSYKDLVDKPVIPEGSDLSDYYNKGETDNLLNSKANTSDLAVVAKSGNYNDLNNTPTIPTKTSELTNDSGYITGVAWGDITSKPSFSDIAISGSYNDLVDTPTIPSKTSELTNDSGYITSVSWEDVTSKPELSQVAISGSYSDLSGTPTIPTRTSQLINDSGFLTSSSGVITSVSWSDITDKPNFSTVATSGSYNDLSNKPTIPKVYNKTLTIQKNGTNVATFTSNSNTDVTADITVPTKVSELSNDSGFITGISWDKVTNKPTLATVATSGSYTDLSNTPTIPTKVSQLENDMGFGTGGDTSDCVHKTGNETINGIKTFTSGPWVTNNGTTIGLSIKNTAIGRGEVPSELYHNTFRVYDKNTRIMGEFCVEKSNSGSTLAQINVRSEDANGKQISKSVYFNMSNDGTKTAFYPNVTNVIDLGMSNYKWAKVYSDDVVHTSGDETIDGNKYFIQDVNVKNSDVDIAVTPSNNLFSCFRFRGKGNVTTASIQYSQRTYGVNDICFYVFDASSISHGFRIRTDNRLEPIENNTYSLGSSSSKWADVYSTNAHINYTYTNRVTTSSIVHPTDDSYFVVSGGTNYDKGASLYLGGAYAKNFTPGRFVLTTRAADYSTIELTGSPDGSLTWGGKSLALDENLVHRTGDETINGAKVFTGGILKKNSAVDLQVNPSANQHNNIPFIDKNNVDLGYLEHVQTTTGVNALGLITKDKNNGYHGIQVTSEDNVIPLGNGVVNLGLSGAKWKNVYATTFNGNLSGTIASSTTATTQATTDNSTRIATTAWVRTYVNSVAGSGSVGASISAYYSNATTLTAKKSSAIGSGSFPAVYSDYINIAPTVGTIYTGSQLFSSFTPTASGTKSSHVYQTYATATATFSGAFSSSAKYLCTTANAVSFRAFVSQGTISDIGTASVVDNSSAKSIFIRVQ